MHAESPSPVTLGDLQHGVVGGTLIGAASTPIRGVQHDSRRVSAGDLFVAVPGERHDGSEFVDDAVRRGAVAVIAERELSVDVPQLAVDDPRLALGQAAESVYGMPTRALHTVGITGTNGKTTTAYLVKQAIEADAGRVALIGTTGMASGDEQAASLHTTPEGDDISRFARRSLDDGATHLVLEVSSHGLALRRVDALRFEVAAFTNLSRDHLDFHRTMEAYREAKARLFTELSPETAVIHTDDAFGAELARRVASPTLRCSRRSDADADLVVRHWSMTRAGIEAAVDTPGGSVDLKSPMLGEHNLENLLVALGCAHALGLDLGRVASAWRTSPGSPGRLERIDHPGDVAVLVDYAHTPDALRRVLQTMRAVTPGRLIAVFGAGGDRDAGKRPEMGRAGVEHADLCVLTSDNPRTEDPGLILQAVVEGARSGAPQLAPAELRNAARGYCPVLDRTDAIRLAIEAAVPGDTVLLAGKGHETYQVVGTERRHFDDREEARAAISRLGRQG